MEIINRKRAVIYCRVSTKEQVEEGNSLATQEKMCNEYALKNGLEIVEKFIEQGESAKTQKRPELQRLLKYCADKKQNKVNAVIAYKIDRISRNTDDYSQIRVLLKRYGVEIISTSEHFEDTPAGRFMHNIIANVSQFDNDVRAERCAGGMKDAMREGRYVWLAPLGYSNVRIAGRATIAPNDKQLIVKRVFEEVAKNLCPTEVIRMKMFDEGLSKGNGKPYSRSQFYRLLSNELYTGWIIKFGERHRGLFDPLVSDELFMQVQRVLKKRSHKSLLYQRENPDFPLRRFVFHPSGKKITGAWSKGRRKKYPYYRFIGISGSQVRKEDIEEKYKEFINEYAIEKRCIPYFKRALTDVLGDTSKNSIKKSEWLNVQIAELKEKQSLLIDRNLDGVISNSVLQQQLALIEEKLLTANATLLDLPDRKRNTGELLGYAMKYLENPGEVWAKLPFETKVKLQWCEFPQGVVFDGKKFRTVQIASIFKAKSNVLPTLSHEVDFMHKSLNTPAVTTTPKESDKIYLGQITKEVAEQYIKDLESIANIMANQS